MADSSFYSAVLRGLGLDVTPFRLNFLTQWAQYEGTGAKYNPLATTQQGGEDPNDPYWNSNGGNPVKNYASFENGVAATVKTLRNGYYPQVIQSLQSEQVVPGTSDNVRTWGTVGFANTLDSGPLASEGTMTAPVDVPKLPFSESDFLVKAARYYALQTALFDPDGVLNDGIDPNDPRVTEFSQLKAELGAYQQAKDSGAQDWGTAIARGTYEGSNDPRNVAADDAAAKAARQFQINQTAGEFTQQDLTEQRSQQNDAETSFNDFVAKPAYQQGTPFRVPSFTLPSKDEMFKKNIDRVMQNMPDVPDHVPGPSLGLPPLPSQFQGPQQQPGPVDLARGALGGGHATGSQLPPAPSLNTNAIDLPPLPQVNGYDRFGGGPIGAQARRRGINGSILSVGRF